MIGNYALLHEVRYVKKSSGHQHNEAKFEQLKGYLRFVSSSSANPIEEIFRASVLFPSKILPVLVLGSTVSSLALCVLKTSQ